MPGVTAAAASGTTGSIADALKTQSMEGMSEALFKNDEVIARFGMPIPFTGGSTLNRKMHYAGNASVSTYSEGDAVGAPGSQSYLTAQWPCAYYKAQIQFTGHAQDQLLGGNPQAAFYNQLELEFTMAAEDMRDKLSTDLLGTGLTAPVGIQGIVDSAGTVAGLSRSTYTWFAAYENSGGTTTVAISDLDGAMQNSADAEYAAQIDQIWTSYKQVNKLKGVIGNPGVANNSVRIDIGNSNAVLNTGSILNGINYGNIPIIPIRDLTNSIILGLTMSTFFLGKMRDWQVDPLAKNDDSTKFLLTGAWGLGNTNPKKNWKITTLTA